MWVLIAIIFVILAIHKLLAGALLGFFVLLLFAGFAYALFTAGMDIV
jgi:hypothetical protein